MRRIPALLSLSLASLACGGTTDVAPQPLAVSVAVGQAAFVPGDTIDVTVTVTNATSADVAVTGSSDCLLAFRVVDRANDVVARSDGACSTEMTTATIPARGQASQSFRWSGDSAGFDSPAPLQPGSYDVVGLLEVQGGLRTSAPVTVRLVAP